MFENSTRVIVISSSHRKGIGPRVGSIGYAVPCGTNVATFLPQRTQFMNGLVLFPLRVAFIRYGYEKERPKYEIKKLIGAIPIVNELRQNSMSEKIIRTCIEKLPKEDFDSHLWLKTKLNLIGKTDNVSTCILAPVNDNSNLITCSNLEFKTWFESFISQEHAKRAVKKIVNNRMYFNKLHDQRLGYVHENLRLYLGNMNDSGLFIKYMLDSVDRRKDLVRFIRIASSIYFNGFFTQHAESITRLLTKREYIYKRGSSNTSMLFCRLVDHMFIDVVTNWKLGILSKAKTVQNRSSIAAKIKKTKEVLESIAKEVSKK